MKKNIIKTMLLIVVFSFVFVFFALDLQQYATLDYIRQQQDAWHAYYAHHRLWALAIFGLLYVIVAALSLPISAVFTLLGGALFGLTIGLIAVSFASSIGATLAFLMARFLAQDYVQKTYAKALLNINNGFRREGVFYLFALRLVPVFPFFMVNILAALMPIKVWQFYWSSQLGMLPGTAVLVYAGTQIASIQSVADIASPSLLVAFALLGIFPLIAKRLITLMRKKREGSNGQI